MLDNAALDAKSSETLPFEGKKQDAFLGHVLNFAKPELFLQVKDRIRGEWFLDGYGGQLYDLLCKFYAAVGRIPISFDEFLLWEELRPIDPAVKIKLRNTELRCRNERANFGQDLVLKELTDWMKVRVYHQSVAKSAELFNKKQINAAVGVLEAAVKDYQTIHFDGTPAADFTDPKGLVTSMALELENAITTGLTVLDRKINPECKKGSLLRGDTTVLIAPTNVGKTTAMITVARHNVLLGKDVLFVAHEGRNADLMEKFWRCTLNCTPGQFKKMVFDTAFDTKVKLASSYLSKHLTYLHLPKTPLTVEEAISVVRMHQNKKIATTGKGYDLLISDYPAILTTEMAKAGKFERRHIEDWVYRQFVQINLELNFHGILAAQTNREGSKVNRRTSKTADHRMLTLEDIAETFGIPQSATNVITMNRDPILMAKNMTAWHLCKSRSHETGWTIVSGSNFGHAMTHSNEMGATAYRGTSSMSDKIDSLLEQYRNQDIPEGIVIASGVE